MRCPRLPVIAPLACLPVGPFQATANWAAERSWEGEAMLMEAEAFENRGGWSVDQQAMHQRGWP